MRLDEVEKLKPGQGQLDLGLVGKGTLDEAFVGGALEYAHRINRTMSAIASGQIGYLFQGGERDLSWQALTGFRWRF